MSFYFPTWQEQQEPTHGNVRHWLQNIYTKVSPFEQARWNQSNIDTLYHAGCQEYVNRSYNFSPKFSYNNYYFNLVQQPVNLITGYERQHRKGWQVQAIEGGDHQTCDQYTKYLTNTANKNGIHEAKSRAKELAAITGMVMAQPYLDFNGRDQAQGECKVKVWDYSSFLVDPFFRDPSMSDANLIWFQEYITKQEADYRFPDKKKFIVPMGSPSSGMNNFYFLPENYNMNRADLLILSYVWYRCKKKKKRLYSNYTNQFYDFSGGDGNMDQILFDQPDMEEVMVDVPSWKLATCLNDNLMYNGYNPLGLDCAPCVPYFWNYDPHIGYQYELRCRSLIYPMRSPQFLFNFKVIQNNDIAAATINQGWKRKSGAVANEENLKQTGQGWDIIINEGFELTDVDKIQPTAVPESDLALAQQMADLIFKVSGIDLENWSGQQDKQISSLTMLMKQAANLQVFQKYFDQWDYSDHLLGDMCLQIGLHNFNAHKIGLIIGEEPTQYFYNKVFSNYKIIVEESDLTPTQQNLQAQHMMDMNAAFQREVFPPSMIIPKLNITGKGEIIPYLQQQEEQANEMQQHSAMVQQALEEGKLRELYSKAANNIASAKERYGRFESNVGLLEERLAEVSKNRALSTKAKMEALEKMIDVIGKYGEIETALKMSQIDSYDYKQAAMEDQEKERANQESLVTEFMSQMNSGMNRPQTQNNV